VGRKELFPSCTHVVVVLGLVGLAVLGVLEQDLVHAGARVLVELLVRVEHDERDLAVAELGQLHGLLEDAVLALGERHLAVAVVLDALDLDLLAAHGLAAWLAVYHIHRDQS
jgi:hypothetical protein